MLFADAASPTDFWVWAWQVGGPLLFILVVGGWFFYKAGGWFGREIIIPLRDKMLQLLSKLEASLEGTTKSVTEQTAAVKRLADGQEKVVDTQLDLAGKHEKTASAMANLAAAMDRMGDNVERLQLKAKTVVVLPDVDLEVPEQPPAPPPPPRPPPPGGPSAPPRPPGPRR